MRQGTKRRRINVYRSGKLVRSVKGTTPYPSRGYKRYALPGTELKFLDNIDAPVTAPTTGIIQPSLALIPQGVGESQRIGRKTTVKKIFIRGVIALPSASLTNQSSDIIRIMVYQDKQANGAAAAVTDLIETADQSSFMNLQNSMRFRVLSDKKYSLNSSACAWTGSSWTTGINSRAFKVSISCNIPLEFSGATGAITELRSNNIGVMLISESGLATAGYYTRIRFSDY